MQVANHDTKANPAVGEHLVQPVRLAGQLVNQFLPLADNQAQFAQYSQAHRYYIRMSHITND